MKRRSISGSLATRVSIYSIGRNCTLINAGVRRTLKMAGVILSLASLPLSVSQSQAQSLDTKFEIGAQATYLKLGSIASSTSPLPGTDGSNSFTLTTFSDNEDIVGLGLRFAYNFNNYFGVETEANIFPADQLNTGRKLQALFGVKLGKRFDRVSMFVKLRPGLIRLSKGTLTPNGQCAAVFGLPGNVACFSPSGLNNFAVDWGGIMEIKTSKRSFIRVDLGDTFIRHGRRAEIAVFQSNGQSSAVVVPVRAATTHNLQTSIGIGFRF